MLHFDFESALLNSNVRCLLPACSFLVGFDPALVVARVDVMRYPKLYFFPYLLRTVYSSHFVAYFFQHLLATFFGYLLREFADDSALKILAKDLFLEQTQGNL